MAPRRSATARGRRCPVRLRGGIRPRDDEESEKLARAFRGSQRYWKRAFLVKEQPTSAFRDALPRLLREGRAWLEAVTETDLEFATTVGG
jgi:hypothetical protein